MNARSALGLPSQVSGISWLSLLALLLPGALFGLGAWCFAADARLAWLDRAHLLGVAIPGGLATLAGVCDWLHHQRGGRFVSAHERRVELLALAGGGGPLFVLMAWASWVQGAAFLLVPVIALAIATVVAIAYDELSYHRRCGVYETACHRVLTGGMGAAWLVWVHGVFVAGGRLS